jgi:hypothetical protein
MKRGFAFGSALALPGWEAGCWYQMRDGAGLLDAVGDEAVFIRIVIVMRRLKLTVF